MTLQGHGRAISPTRSAPPFCRQANDVVDVVNGELVTFIVAVGICGFGRYRQAPSPGTRNDEDPIKAP